VRGRGGEGDLCELPSAALFVCAVTTDEPSHTSEARIFDSLEVNRSAAARSEKRLTHPLVR
jgi:hypothetical protein